MSDFDRLKAALEEGRLVALDEGKDGSIQFGDSFKNYDEVIDSKYSSDNPEAMKLLPKCVFVRKEPETWIL